VVLAVEATSRIIIGAHVNRMPAKGLLAAKSRAKYGPRADERSKGWAQILQRMSEVCTPDANITSDENPHYSRFVKLYFPKSAHRKVSGGRGCIAGYGELKKKGFDPMFSLNHTCAMFRDNLACLKRRTWTTTKKPESLQVLIDIYIKNHNTSILSR
jgi:hypothetical protein